MWCCFTANTVIEPKKIPLKPLAAEVPVAVKPVTLMFRLPSEEAASAPSLSNPLGAPPAPAPVPSLLSATSTPLQDELEDAQGEEVPVLDRSAAKTENSASIILALGIIGILYLLMQNEISHHTDL